MLFRSNALSIPTERQCTVIKVYSEQTEEIFQKIADEACSLLGLGGVGQVEVCFVDGEEIKSLNAQTRNIDKVTDVLSFPMLNEIADFTEENYPLEYDYFSGEVTVGSIVICNEVAIMQANEYGHSEERERCYLFTHGLLHLLGYDHIEQADKEKMREMEEKILLKLGIGRSEE